MRRPKRPPVGQRPVGQLSGDGEHHRELEQFARVERRQDRGQSARQHRLSGAGRAVHQQVIDIRPYEDILPRIGDTMRPKAFSYLRFSTPEQAKGDSFRRQSIAAEEYAARKGLELDRSLSFEDLGVSAFRGANAETGKLGEFRRAVEDGFVQAGSYLLVESLDRISRSAARKALTLLGDIADLGITIVTLNDGREYTADSLNNDPISLLVALVTFIRANEESATKGMRVRAAWNAKRSRALDKPLTSRTPAWITLSAVTGKLELVPERAAVVVRIFQMLRDGAGQHRVAETLNREGVPTFGDAGTRRKAAQWHRSYIAKISRNPAVIGVLVPFIVENDASGNKVRRALPPIEGYYPAAVDPETFHAVQAATADGVAPKSRSEKGVQSLLAGLARCPSCGSTMTRVQKGPKGGRPRFVCVKAKAGAGCAYVGIPQDVIEWALVANAEYLAGTMPTGDENIDADMQRAEATLGGIEDGISNLIDAITVNPMPSLLDRLTALEEERRRVQAEISEIAERGTTMTAASVERRMAELCEVLQAEPVDVPKANALLRQSARSIVIDYMTGSLHVEWKQGGESRVTFAMPREEPVTAE